MPSGMSCSSTCPISGSALYLWALKGKGVIAYGDILLGGPDDAGWLVWTENVPLRSNPRAHSRGVTYCSELIPKATLLCFPFVALLRIGRTHHIRRLYHEPDKTTRAHSIEIELYE